MEHHGSRGRLAEQRARPLGPGRVGLAALALVALASAACSSAPPPVQSRRRAAPDRSLAALDRVLTHQTPAHQREACLARLGSDPRCPTSVSPPRQLSLRMALDQRYTEHWPRWEERLARTLECVNALYAPTAIRWDVTDVVRWEPGAQRHDLRHLLQRIQRELPPDGKSLVVGLTLWDKRRVYSSASGEIGLSQRGACVVPSWPRMENDCVTLAHELAHLVGARHVPGRQWVMSWAGHPFHLPGNDPLARVMARYRFHPRNRLAIDLSRHARHTDRGLRLPPECHEKLRAADRCWGL